MELLNCKNCGAPLTDDGRCEYCGARYERVYNQNRPILILQEEAKVERLTACVEIPRAYVRPGTEEAVKEYSIREMRTQMADGLLAAMKIMTSEDPVRDLLIVRGEVRVVPPDMRL